MSLNYLATRFRCTWPWDILVMLCDGRIVCGCADPYAKRVLGDARTHSIEQIWTGPFITKLRGDMNAGGSAFCGDCPLKLPLAEGEEPRPRSLDAGRLPGRMFIECTAACNISCFQACCAPETGITKTRQAGMLDFDLLTKVIDEAGPHLGRVDFFNYGEAFLHKRAVEMCEYIKSRYPHIYLYTSTNGGALSEAQARRLVHSGIDEVTFSIDGARPESYIQYRQRGKFDVSMRNLRAMADEKRASGRDLPFPGPLPWRRSWSEDTSNRKKRKNHPQRPHIHGARSANTWVPRAAEARCSRTQRGENSGRGRTRSRDRGSWLSEIVEGGEPQVAEVVREVAGVERLGVEGTLQPLEPLEVLGMAGVGEDRE